MTRKGGTVPNFLTILLLICINWLNFKQHIIYYSNAFFSFHHPPKILKKRESIKERAIFALFCKFTSLATTKKLSSHQILFSNKSMLSYCQNSALERLEAEMISTREPLARISSRDCEMRRSDLGSGLALKNSSSSSACALVQKRVVLLRMTASMSEGEALESFSLMKAKFCDGGWKRFQVT